MQSVSKRLEKEINKKIAAEGIQMVDTGERHYAIYIIYMHTSKYESNVTYILIVVYIYVLHH
jgi:hypothetical protein